MRFSGSLLALRGIADTGEILTTGVDPVSENRFNVLKMSTNKSKAVASSGDNEELSTTYDFSKC